MRGPIQDFSTKEYYVSDKNLMEGIPKEELWMYSNLSVTGSYGRGVQTRDGGYDTKKMLSAMQSVVLDKDGSDCGTDTYITKTINESNKKDNIYRWIMTDTGLVQLSTSNISQYFNKPIEMRSPMACKGEKICSKCAGGLYYIMNIKNVVQDIMDAPVNEIIGEMAETISLDKKMDDIVQSEVERLTPDVVQPQLNTKRKQVSTTTTRRSVRRKFKAGFRP